jgi:hypothetical protein
MMMYLQVALDDDERLVGIRMPVPNKIALQLHQFELVIVHFGDNFRLPLLVE